MHMIDRHSLGPGRAFVLLTTRHIEHILARDLTPRCLRHSSSEIKRRANSSSTHYNREFRSKWKLNSCEVAPYRRYPFHRKLSGMWPWVMRSKNNNFIANMVSAPRLIIKLVSTTQFIGHLYKSFRWNSHISRASVNVDHFTSYPRAS